MSRDELQQVYEMIKAGDKVQAAAMLQPIVATDPDNVQAWWLLANALDDPLRKRSALRQVLRLQPDHSRAQAMMNQIDDPLAEPFDDLYDDEAAAAPGGRVVVTRPKGQNRNCLVIFLVILLGSCALCTLSTLALGGTAVTYVMQAIDDPEVRAALAAITDYASYVTLPGDLDAQGVIEPGQTVTRSLNGDRDQSWTFTGDSGDRYTVTVNTVSGSLTPVIFIYEPGGTLRGIEGSIGTGERTGRFTLSLSPGGKYTIVVSAFGDSSGEYELTLERN